MIELIKKIFCKHEYINIKTIYKTIESGEKIKGTRDECRKCGKVCLDVKF